MSSDILIVDDETDICRLVAGILEDEGHGARMAHDADGALAAIAQRRPSLIFLDIWLQGSRLDGLALLDEIKRQHQNVPVVMISGHGNVETAVSAIKRGAYDYIEKPFKADRLVLIAERALEASNLKREVADLRQRAPEQGALVGNSWPMRQLRSAIEKIAPTNSRVLISGPSGAGKEAVARAIHALSSRANGRFVALSAAAMMPERVEMSLFGTGAVNSAAGNNGAGNQGGSAIVGALEDAHNGTLYIDEIADMPMETQGKILRALVEQSFQRLDGTRVDVDVRIISSSSRDLELEIDEKRLRSDLFHRLNVVSLRVPSLAERREDIGDLAKYFLQMLCQGDGHAPRQLGEDALTVLQAHEWPGNLRQLRNNIERLLIMSDVPSGSLITADQLPDDIGSLMPSLPSNSGGEQLLSLPLREAREHFERDYLQAQVNRFGGNISRTAEFVGMERSALHRKLKTLRLA